MASVGRFRGDLLAVASLCLLFRCCLAFLDPLPPCPRYLPSATHSLLPWARRGIRESDLVAAEGPPVGARYRVYLIDQEVYVAALHRGGGRLCPESRWRYTVWGLLQLLRVFPERRVPDVVLNFYCYDTPKVNKHNVQSGRFGAHVPFLLSYCSSADHLDVPWPDYSFFGWPEIRIPSWEAFSPRMLDAANYSRAPGADIDGEARLWKYRDARLFWRGNLGKAARDRAGHENNWKPGYKGPNAALSGHAFRATLVRECTQIPGLSEMIDVDEVVWSETPEGASHQSRNLEAQCKNRFMMYLEGGAWSTSLKYQAICGSTLLGVEPFYSDFYSDYLIGKFADSSLKSVDIPRDQEKMCTMLYDQLKMLVNDPQRSVQVGSAIQNFIAVDLDMRNVYRYMLTLLDGIAYLQKFDPREMLEADRLKLKSKPQKVTEESWIKEAGKQGAMYMTPTVYTNLTACVENDAKTQEALFEDALAHRHLAASREGLVQGAQ